ncbi:MAG: glycerophosphodiester phosphodiesterase [Alphaproteobacteria bacterium]|nr:glycerophosphodiester phosphodiesterase [Alphaproteobacteria bacterium]
MRVAGLIAATLCSLAAPATAFDLQGHRGARGLFPENTLPAFRAALELGVTTLETDLAITSDGAVLLTHDPVLNRQIVRDTDGKWLDATPRIANRLTLAEIKRLDVGRIDPTSRYATQFPRQQPIDGTRMPTLAELVAVTGPTVRFNLETKLRPDRPDETLAPGPFAARVIAEVRQLGIAPRTTLQSFDWRTLVEARRLAPEIPTACLSIESGGMDTVGRAAGTSPWLAGVSLSAQEGSVPKAAKSIGCSIWSPFFRNVNAAEVAAAQALGLKVIPWTVNDPGEMARLIDLKVDGLITDYPDLAVPILKAKGVVLR